MLSIACCIWMAKVQKPMWSSKPAQVETEHCPPCPKASPSEARGWAWYAHVCVSGIACATLCCGFGLVLGSKRLEKHAIKKQHHKGSQRQMQTIHMHLFWPLIAIFQDGPFLVEAHKKTT